ncbi:hypothetical protein BGX38DRAFT_666162 [Terfezia claveryi]|nr:hypothetical protein BGX38DRAFT_666162 [Terfezia claveryi]
MRPSLLSATVPAPPGLSLLYLRSEHRVSRVSGIRVRRVNRVNRVNRLNTSIRKNGGIRRLLGESTKSFYLCTPREPWLPSTPSCRVLCPASTSTPSSPCTSVPEVRTVTRWCLRRHSGACLRGTEEGIDVITSISSAGTVPAGINVLVYI